MYPFTIYKYCSKVSDFSSYVIGGDSIALNPYKSDSIWLKKKWGPKIWIDNFSLAVNHLPSVYDAEKKNVLKTFGSRSTFFTFKGLLNWRAEDNYNRKIYKQYGSKIMDMSYLSKNKLKLILLVPKFMLKALRKVLKERKKKKLLDN